MPGTALIPRQTLVDLLQAVQTARGELAQAFLLMRSAQTRLKACVGAGTGGGYDSLWPSPLSDYNLTRTAETVDAFQVQQAWQRIIAQTGLTHWITDARARELHTQLEEGKTLPELTIDNVLATLQALAGDSSKLLDETIAEVWQWLRPCHTTYKTNKKYRIGEKVIVSYALNDWGNKTINHHRERQFRSLGTVLSLLDGQGVPVYPHDLVTQLNEQLRQVEYGTWFTVSYLRCKVYENRNAHMVFTRPDLLTELNRRAGEATALAGTD